MADLDRINKQPAPVAGQDTPLQKCPQCGKEDAPLQKCFECGHEWYVDAKPTAQDVMDALEDDVFAREIANECFNAVTDEHDFPITAIRKYRAAVRERLTKQKGTP